MWEEKKFLAEMGYSWTLSTELERAQVWRSNVSVHIYLKHRNEAFEERGHRGKAGEGLWVRN